MCSLTKMMSVTLIDISSCYFINILIDGCVTNPSPSLVFVFRCLNQRLISLELSAAFRFPPSKTHPLEFLRFFNFRQRFAWNLFRMVATKFRILARFFGTRQGFLNEILINDISFGSMAFYAPPPPPPWYHILCLSNSILKTNVCYSIETNLNEMSIQFTALKGDRRLLNGCLRALDLHLGVFIFIDPVRIS